MALSIGEGLGFASLASSLGDASTDWQVNGDSHKFQTTGSAPLPIRPGETLKRSVNGGETQTFFFDLTTGQYAQVVIRWQGMDLDVLVRNPDRTLLFPTSIPIRGLGPIPLTLIADQTGTYSIEVQTLEQVKIPGSFDIIFSDLRFPADEDRDRFSALRLMAEGQALESKPLQIEKYQKALQHWESASDPLGRAYALWRLGNAYISSKDIPNAAKHYKALIELRELLDDPRSLLYTRREIGQDYRAFDSPTKAIEFYQPALQLARQIKDRRAEAALLYSIGFAQARIGRLNEALKLYDGARQIQHEDNDRLSEASTLNAMGGAYGALGDQVKALEFYEQAAALRAELNDNYRAAIIINNIGLVYDDLGDLQKAKDKYLEALTKYKSLLNNDVTVCKAGASSKILAICNSIANTSDNIGEFYNTIGDPQSALETFQQSLTFRRTLKQPQSIGSTLTHIGYSHALQGQPEKAIEDCIEALEYNLQAQDRRGEASSYTVLGMAHMALNDTEKALKYYGDALRLQREAGERRGEGITLDQMGRAYARNKDLQSAFQSYDQALKLWREVKDQEWETRTLYNIANAERDRGDLTRAREQIEKAIQIVESQRAGLTSSKLRTSFFANKEEMYELDIDLRMQLTKAQDSNKYVTTALETSEKARARVLIDLLSETGVGQKLGSGFDQNSDPRLVELVVRKQRVQHKLNSKGQSQTTLLGGKHTQEQAAAIAKEIEELTNDYDELEKQIRDLRPRYAELMKPRPLSVAQIQLQLDDSTLLVEYSLGDKRSYVWVVTPDSIKGFELAGRKEIEATAERMIRALTERNRRAKGESPQQWALHLSRADAEYSQASAELSKMVIQPVAALLGNKRLVIVADGALQLVPFQALPNPQSSNPPNARTAKSKTTKKAGAQNDPRPLVEDHEIVYQASASVLALQRKEFGSRQPARHALAVLADPVFDQEGLKIEMEERRADKARNRQPPPAADSSGSSRGANASSRTDLTRAIDDMGIGPISKLPHSREEAAAIMKVVPKGEGKAALGFDASRATVMSPDLSQYRIIHFATHGLADLNHPELSGIVLSMVDEKGQQQDGYFRLHEIYNLNLPADLVVLSACQTGVGKQIRGEGLIALTRGFTYAGAARVVASLWKVDDEATRDLMEEFYKQMFTNKLKPAAALRKAQINLSHQSQWRSPYYWAGFVLQGEWK